MACAPRLVGNRQPVPERGEEDDGDDEHEGHDAAQIARRGEHRGEMVEGRAGLLEIDRSDEEERMQEDGDDRQPRRPFVERHRDVDADAAGEALEPAAAHQLQEQHDGADDAYAVAASLHGPADSMPEKPASASGTATAAR